MVYFSTLICALSTGLNMNLVHAAPAAPSEDSVLHTNHTKMPGVINMPIQRVQYEEVGNVHMPHLNQKVDGDNGQGYPQHAEVIESLANQRYFYKAEVEIGTPPQKLSLLVDTGSSDTWVFSPQTDRGKGSKASQSNAGSVFDPTRSSTFKNNNTDWLINYGKGSATGMWGHDVFQIGGIKLNSLSIGVAKKVQDINTGLIGVGRPNAETTFIRNNQFYNNLPVQLKAEGLINSAAYSLSLNDLNDAQGSLIFGGVDHDLYSGDLVEVPITHKSHFGVTLNGITPVGARATYNMMTRPRTAILDSGTSLSYVDDNTLETIRTALNTNPSFTIGMKYYADCNITKALSFDFGAISIPVPAYNFLWPIRMFVDKITASLAFPTNSCYLGIESAGKSEDFILLGDNVLRAMYIVYDITGSRIGLAQSKASSGKPNIEPIMPNKPLPGTKQF